MDHSAQRVAARFRTVIAVQVSDKWFKTKKSELKAILAKTLSSSVRYWSNPLNHDLRQFFDKFFYEFEELVYQTGGGGSVRNTAVDSIKARTESVKEYVQAVVEKVDKLEGPEHDLDNPTQYLAWLAWQACHEKLESTVKTVGDLLKYEWTIDSAYIDKIVKNALKKESAQEGTGRTWIESTATKAIKKTKLDRDLSKWVDDMAEMLQANYSQQALDKESGYREFDLHGVKVVIRDRAVQPADTKKYIGYLYKAYAALKAKGFAKAWYGNVYIDPEGDGGVNQNTGGGVGGWYETHPDTVSIFNRPAWYITELMVHELGHRYWFKQMSGSQRQRFESLVKAHTLPRPSKVPEGRLLKHHLPERVRDKDGRAERMINRIRDNAPWGKADIEEFIKNLRALAFEIQDITIALPLDKDVAKDPEVLSLKRDVARVRYDFENKAEELASQTPATLASWVEEARESLAALTASALILLDFATQKHNEVVQERFNADPNVKKWQDSYENNPAPVAPVSDYGKSNISEAFAEVFAHYVLEYDISRDQVESFRSVLSSDAAERLAHMFLASTT